MKLKRVKILGFKTFADKTEFDLDGNIIAVVGPNGCGKSNIVDAILWGLGESNARQLRAQTSKEVIFAGSVHRKPVGVCEVSLLFDNEDASLPLDAPEVMITRRLTRAGDSDYQINKRNCRLRDVNELLADSGLGRAGYAIVGQSEIDQALAASPQQRRAWIDEAAGVQRYRARRTESIRRLDAARDHLSRVQDIIAEIESQREPLAEEAEVARRYKTALHSLREVESGLLAKELESAVSELEQLTKRIASAQTEADDHINAAIAHDAEAKAIQGRLEELEAHVERQRRELQAAQSATEQAASAWQIATNKLESLDQLEETLRTEADAGSGRIALAETDFESAKAELELESAARETLRENLGGASDEAKVLSAQLREIEQQLSQAKRALQEAQKHEIEAAHREDRLRQIAAELDGIVATLPDLESAIAEAQERLDELERKCSERKAALQEAEARLQSLRKDADAHSGNERRLLAELAAIEGRRKGIEQTIDAHEGLAQGARSIMAAVDSGTLSADYQPVGTAVTVSSHHALAIDTALGAAANDLIVPNEQAAKAGIQYLKENRLGRATFQPLTLMRPFTPSNELRSVLKQKGVVGLASDLVDCDASVRPVVESLLGRIVVVEDLDVALALSRTSGWSRIVTADGELLHASGAVTGGASIRQAVGLVQRQAELTELAEEAENLAAELEKLRKASESFEESQAAALATCEELRQQLRSDSQEAEEARAWWLNLTHEHQVTARAQDKLTGERERLSLPSPAVTADAKDVARLETERDEAVRQLAARSSDKDHAATRLAEADLRVAAARDRVKESERRLKILHESEDQRGRKTAGLEPERARFREMIEAALRDRETHQGQVDSLSAAIQSAIEGKKLLAQEASRQTELAREAERKANRNAEEIHQSELARARLDSRRSVAVQRLLEEYGITAEEAIAMAPTVELPDDVVQVVSRLRRELKSMGDVNLGAIEAYERLSERHDELANQVADIESGMGEVESSIRELDRLTRDRFRDTFEAVRTAFGQTFTRIFGGGEGILELSDPGDILDSGVDISVTVPGKRRQRLELLSGGERAMSAIAFLFALLHVKPSPLVVLDEVDAPLDGRNVERFIQLMRDFNTNSQFILITHNPVTIESADVWFGVTMQEPGVSTLIPFRVPDPALTKAVVPDAYLKG